MIIKNKNLINYKCYYQNCIRLTYIDNKIYVFICCSSEYGWGQPIAIYTIEEILSNDIFEKLSENIKNHKIKIHKQCFDTIYDIDNKECLLGTKCLSSKIDIVEFCTEQSCNLNCKMCTLKHHNSKEITDLYFKLLYHFKGHHLEQISLTQQGEPFFHKKETFEYLTSLTPDDCKKICIVSNLTLLNDDDIKKLVEINKKIKIIIVASIDGLTEDTYKKIRNNNLFLKVMHNADLLIKYNILDSVNFVVQNENIHELLLAYEYWNNIKNIKFKAIPVNNLNDSYIEDNELYKKYLKIITN